MVSCSWGRLGVRQASSSHNHISLVLVSDCGTSAVTRAQHVGIFNFDTDQVWVLVKILGSGRVSGIFSTKNSIGYFRVLKILIGYFWVHPNIVQFLCERLIYIADLSHQLATGNRLSICQIRS